MKQWGDEFLRVPPQKQSSMQVMLTKWQINLKQLTPNEAGVDKVLVYLKNKRLFTKAENVFPKITADLFIWGMLSRGAGPVQQESAFIDIIDGARPLIDKAYKWYIDVQNKIKQPGKKQ